jgi:hypothetical protein
MGVGGCGDPVGHGVAVEICWAPAVVVAAQRSPLLGR